MEGFEFLGSLPFLSEERLVTVRWNRNAGVLQYTLSCSNEDCRTKTLNGNVDSALLMVFKRDEVIVTLIAIYQCTTNTSTAQVTVPAITTPAPTPVPAPAPTPACSTGISSIRCTYF